MKPLLRRFVIAGVVIASIVALGVGWIASAFLFSPCQYQLTHARISPSERYVAEIYGANCGMGGSRDVVVLRDRSAVALMGVDGMPPGTVVANEFAPSGPGEEIAWEGETRLLLRYRGRAPNIVRSEWGGVRVEAQRLAQ